MNYLKVLTAVAAVMGALALTVNTVMADPTHHAGGSETTPRMAQADTPPPSSGMPQRPMMGPGMMGQGMGPCAGSGSDRDLSTAQVKDIIEGHIAWSGNERLKVGKVEKKDDATYVAEIVTVDDSLVQKFEVDRNTGAMRPVK